MTIYSICANPTVDVSGITEKVQPIRKTRTVDARMEPGGGGVNVSRVLAEFGLSSHLLYLSGGSSGAMLDEALAKYAFDLIRVAIAEPTRLAFNVHERSSGLDYRFVPEGPLVAESEARQWQRATNELPIKPGDLVVASGSLPRGLSATSYAALSTLTAERGGRFILDCSGEALRAALSSEATPPFLVKPSLGELQSATGSKSLSQRSAERAALQLVDAGRATHVVVSMGAHGALHASSTGVRYLPALRVPSQSTVGAGDSFLGAMVWRLAKDDTVAQAFDYGVAGGAAAVTTGGTELCTKATVEKLYQVLKRRERRMLEA